MQTNWKNKLIMFRVSFWFFEGFSDTKDANPDLLYKKVMDESRQNPALYNYCLHGTGIFYSINLKPFCFVPVRIMHNYYFTKFESFLFFTYSIMYNLHLLPMIKIRTVDKNTCHKYQISLCDVICITNVKLDIMTSATHKLNKKNWQNNSVSFNPDLAQPMAYMASPK